MRRIYTTLLATCAVGSFMVSTVFGQEGPGGVGTSTSNRFWFEASDLSGFSNGTALTTWTNRGGNSNDFSQSSSSQRPLVQNNVTDNLNGFPVLRFDGSNDVYEMSNSSDLNSGGPWTQRTFFLVFRTGSDISSRQMLFEEGGGTRGLSFYVFNGSLYIAGWNQASDGTAAPWNFVHDTRAVTTNTTYILTFVFNGGTSSVNGTILGYVNGSADLTLSSIGTLYGHTGDINLGASGGTRYETGTTTNNESEYASVDMAEFIMYNTAFSEAERIIVENYLAAKYGLSLSSNDLYAYDQSGSGDFDFDLIGIGQDNTGANNTSAQGLSFLRVENASSLSNGEYLMLAHDGGSVAAWSTTGTPDANSIQRLAREWRVREVGNVGTVDLTLDVSTLPALPSGYSYALMVDSDGDFTSGASTYPLTFTSGTEYELTGLDVSEGLYITPAVYRPAVSFANAASSDLESVSPTLDVQLNYVPASNISYTFTYSTSNGSATSGNDYTAVSGASHTAVFSAGSTTATLPAISVTDDVLSESDEDFTVTLTAGTGFVISPISTHTYTILDNDNATKVSFDASSSSGSEATTSVSIPISLSAVSGVNVSVSYSATGGTATSGSDYSAVSGTVQILAGNVSGSIPLTVINDGTFESDETVTITLSSPVNASLQTPISHTYTILDNDDPEISFVSSSGSVSEGSSGTATVQIDQTIAQDVTVNYTVSNGTTTSADQANSNGSVILNAGQSTVDISYTTIEDCDVELTETFTLTLSSVSFGVLGSGTTHEVSILDDDSDGPGGIGCGLELWFRADAGISSSGGSISSWTNDAGSSANLSQSSSSNQPVHTVGSSDETFNFNSYVTFDGSSDYLALSDLNYSTSSVLSQIYAWVVFRTDYSSGSYNNNWSFLDFDRSDYWNMYIHGSDGTMSMSYDGASSIRDNHATSALNDNVPHIGATIYDNTVVDDTRIRADGVDEYFRNRENTGVSIGSGTTRYGFVGDGSEASGFDGSRNTIYYDGDIAELIYFANEVLSSDEINRVESYLALKYGITLSASDDAATSGIDERDYRDSDGTVVWDFSTHGSYNNAIAGIGRDDATSLQKAQSRSVETGAMLTVQSGSLSDHEFLVWGHDGGGFGEETDAPDEFSARIAQVWRAHEVGETGNLSVSFDLSGLSGLPSSASEFALAIGSDTDFSDATSHTTGATLNGNILSFSSVDLDQGDYFTIAYRSAITWDGSVYANGSGAANSPGSGDGDRKFFVQGAGATLSASANVQSMVVNGGAALTLPSGVTLTVNESVRNNGTVTIQNTAALVQRSNTAVNSGGGTYAIQRQGKNTPDAYNIWSSPVASATILGAGVFGSANPCDLFVFNASEQEWRYDYPASYSATCNGVVVATFDPFRMTDGTADGVMDVGRGYFVPGNASPTRAFSGTANNGTYTIPVYSTGVMGNPWSGDDWNLIGNPYPSGVRIDSFLNANSAILNTSAVYFWEDDGTVGAGYNETDDYATVNGLGYVGSNNGNGAHPVPPAAITSGQGFWVDVVSNGSVVFRNSMRTGTDNDKFFKRNQSNDDGTRFWVRVVTPESLTNTILVGFKPDATPGFDAIYDARKNQGNYSILLGSVLDGIPYVIQGLPPLLLGETRTVPLVLQTDSAGVHGFELANEADASAYSIVLHDKVTGKKQNIRQGIYSAYLDSAGMYWDRFELIFDFQPAQAGDPVIEDPTDTAQVTTGFDTPEQTAVRVLPSENELLLEFPAGNPGYDRIELVDVTGRVLDAFDVAGEPSVRISRFTSPQVWFVRLSGSAGMQVHRIYW